MAQKGKSQDRMKITIILIKARSLEQLDGEACGIAQGWQGKEVFVDESICRGAEKQRTLVFIHHLLCSDKHYRGRNQGPGVRPTGLKCLSDLECVKQTVHAFQPQSPP
ncbi:MAG: hypothetical protein ACOC43_12430 [Desulfohalobiaceae bacterium]